MNTATEELFEALQDRAITAKQIQELIADGAEVNERQGYMSPLQVAVDSGAGLSAIKALIDAGADVNACFRLDDLSEEDQDVNAEDLHAPLLSAVMRTDDEAPAIVTALCEAGADPNLHSDDYGMVALHYAHTREVIETLILHGADVNAEDCFGGTPLWYLLGSDGPDFDCIKALIYAGADPSLGDSDSKTNAFDHIDSYCESHPEVKREELVQLLERNKSSEDTEDDEDTWDML